MATPNEPQRLYAAARRRLLVVSDDCGETWRGQSAPAEVRREWASFNGVVLDRGGRLYLFQTYGDTYLMSTADGGVSWRYEQTPELQCRKIPCPPGETRSSSSLIPASNVVTSPNTSGFAYASGENGKFRGTFRTTDDGEHWDKTSESARALIAVDVDPNVIYEAASGALSTAEPDPFVGLFRSTDGGRTSEPFTRFPSLPIAGAIAPDGSRFWVVTTSGHLYLSRDRGVSWDIVALPNADTRLRHVSVNPLDPATLFAVAESGELWTYGDRETDAAPVP
ncbi:MAG: hypothetical protein U0821_23620 [Chloroflexota bacterium]